MRLMRTTRMKPDPRWSADEVMGRVVEMNDARAKALERYSSVRTYHLECHCVSDKKADMVVRTDYQAPNKKEFTIVSESGSGTVRDRVFKKLLEAEQESMRDENQQRSAITPENYTFQVSDYEKTALAVNEDRWVCNPTICYHNPGQALAELRRAPVQCGERLSSQDF